MTKKKETEKRGPGQPMHGEQPKVRKTVTLDPEQIELLKILADTDNLSEAVTAAINFYIEEA